jgi:hypothetical protein
MLFVKTKPGLSSIHGIGCFADEFIKKGTLVRKFVEGFDIEIPKEKVDSLPDAPRERILNYAYFDKETNLYTLNPDDERFVNHSDNPNVGDDLSRESELGEMYALRDIQKGEEITENYNEFDDDIFKKLTQEKNN